MRTNIKLGLYLLLPTALLALLNHVISKLTGNAFFPAPPLTLLQMQALSDAFAKSIDDSMGGSVESRTIRDAKVLEVRTALIATADYVRAESYGDATKLASSGFELAKKPEPINTVGIPGNVTVTATDVANEVLVRWGKAEGAKMGRVERALSDPTLGTTTWVTVGQTTRQRMVVSGMPSYEACWFRVIGIGKTERRAP
jgi:hypothetical protein